MHVLLIRLEIASSRFWCLLAGFMSTQHGVHRLLLTSLVRIVQIWFDGGYTTDMKDKLTSLLATHQNTAIGYNGGGVRENLAQHISSSVNALGVGYNLTPLPANLYVSGHRWNFPDTSTATRRTLAMEHFPRCCRVSLFLH